MSRNLIDILTRLTNGSDLDDQLESVNIISDDFPYFEDFDDAVTLCIIHLRKRLCYHVK